MTRTADSVSAWGELIPQARLHFFLTLKVKARRGYQIVELHILLNEMLILLILLSLAATNDVNMGF